MTVDIGHLNVTDQLGKGGFATVWRVAGYSVPDETGPFVLKRYREKVLQSFPALGFSLQALIAKRQNLSDEDRTRLDRRTVWPLQVVAEHSRVVGLIMRELPQRFFHDLPLTRGGTKRVIREMQMYFCSPTRSSANRLPDLRFDARLMALAHFGSQLAYLHDKDVIVGDIQGSNAAIDPGDCTVQGVRIFMVDSDSFRTMQSRPAIPQPHARSWEPPEISLLCRKAVALPAGHEQNELRARAAVQTKKTDVYKFGLLVIRLLAMTNGVATATDPAIAKGQMIRQLGPRRTGRILQALDPQPNNRPTMAELKPELIGK